MSISRGHAPPLAHGDAMAGSRREIDMVGDHAPEGDQFETRTGGQH